jgi:hypothetical protein
MVKERLKDIANSCYDSVVENQKAEPERVAVKICIRLNVVVFCICIITFYNTFTLPRCDAVSPVASAQACLGLPSLPRAD